MTAGKPSTGEALLIKGIGENMTERRLYAFLDTKTSAAGVVIIEATIQGRRDGQVVFEVPCGIADYNGVDYTDAEDSLVNAGGTPVGDSLVIVVPKQLDTLQAQVVMQPFRLNAQINELALMIKTVTDLGDKLTGYYFFIGIFSAQI